VRQGLPGVAERLGAGSLGVRQPASPRNSRISKRFRIEIAAGERPISREKQQLASPESVASA
jgi:hypothetical protein